MTRVIQKVDEKYVGKDCIQMMVGYRNYLVIFDNGENLYCDFPNCEYIHSYIEDERRKEFPYSNIPTHIKRVLFQKYKVANQLLNFNTPYFIFSSEFSRISYAIRDGENALFVNDFFPSFRVEEEYVTRKELEDFFGKNEDGLNCFYYNGNWCGSLIMPTQEDILIHFKQYMKNHWVNKWIPQEGAYYDWQRNQLISIIENTTSNSIPKEYNFCTDDILMIKSKGKELFVSLVSIRYINENSYKIIKRIVPINHYTLEQIKEMNEKIVNANEPRISLSLNPNLTKEDIVEGAKLKRILK